MGMQRKILSFRILKVVCAGAIIHPIMLNRFFNGPIGFHNGVRISAAFNICLLLVANILCKTRLPPRKTENRLRLKDFICDAPYVLLIIGFVFSSLVSRSRTLINMNSIFLTFCGLFFPFFYLQLNAVYHNMDASFAFYAVRSTTTIWNMSRMKLASVIYPQYSKPVWSYNSTSICAHIWGLQYVLDLHGRDGHCVVMYGGYQEHSWSCPCRYLLWLFGRWR